MGTWDVNPLEHCIYLHLHLNLHPLSSQNSSVVACWGNAMHPSQVEYGIFFSLLVTGLLCIDF